MNTPRDEYFIYGQVPVHIFSTEDGGLAVYAQNWITGQLEPRTDYLLEIEFDRSGLAREVSREVFEGAVREQQARIQARELARSA